MSKYRRPIPFGQTDNRQGTAPWAECLSVRALRGSRLPSRSPIGQHSLQNQAISDWWPALGADRRELWAEVCVACR